MLELSLHINAAAMVSNVLCDGLFQRFSTLPSPQAGGMGRGSAASETGLEVSLSKRPAC
jgi:hypothetical protein